MGLNARGPFMETPAKCKSSGWNHAILMRMFSSDLKRDLERN